MKLRFLMIIVSLVPKTIISMESIEQITETDDKQIISDNSQALQNIYTEEEYNLYRTARTVAKKVVAYMAEFKPQNHNEPYLIITKKNNIADISKPTVLTNRCVAAGLFLTLGPLHTPWGTWNFNNNFERVHHPNRASLNREDYLFGDRYMMGLESLFGKRISSKPFIIQIQHTEQKSNETYQLVKINPEQEKNNRAKWISMSERYDLYHDNFEKITLKAICFCAIRTQQNQYLDKLPTELKEQLEIKQ